ncbi:hypothetical protein H2199_009069 [Coniosporium tulheliwenetii]|uniref:Uncharacterized protein n=2 Tax=Coniosporium tulheliwenetii TaxID=3383036 RepID=A0ACC2YGB3_9PEZI|nr:hypothetical protein H2199_009255 [Cladosporium sp. JES 115]KAJ9634239.1 hypothetical protein H2199_009069 [Cladosporium sp. JES 115]
MPSVLRNDDLVAKAFAGDEVVADSEKETKAQVAEEDEKTIGAGPAKASASAKKREQKNRFVSKQEGVKAANRKDAKLKHVTINEKRVRKNAKLAVLPEVVTKTTLQDFTKPGVLVRPWALVMRSVLDNEPHLSSHG